MPTLQPGSTSQAFDVDIGQTVSVTPGSGGTMLVEYTTNSEIDIRNGSATWQAWTAGMVSSATSDVAMFPLFARVTAYTAAGQYDLSGSGLRAVPSQYLAWKSDVVSARDPVSAAAVVGAARIATPLVIGVAGDSFAQRHGTQVEPLQRGDATWLVGMSNGSLRWGGNIGVGGANTSECLATLRSNTAWRSWDILMLHIGINTLSSSSELSLTQTLSDLREIYALVRSAGVRLCHPLLPPVDTAALTVYAARYSDAPVINQFIREFARENAWMVAPDVFAATVDPASATYAPLSGIAPDGIHVSNLGAYKRALIEKTEFERAGWIHDYMRAGRVASNLDSRAVSANSNQLITNPMLVGTGGSKSVGSGSITGNVPDNWTASNLAGAPAVTLSIVTAPSGARGLRIQATTAGATAQFVLICSTMHSYVAAGDVLETCVDVDVTDNTNAWFNWRLRPTIGGSTTSIDSMYSDAAGPAAVEPTLTPNIRTTLTGAPTNLTAQFFIQMLASASVDIVISLPECRKA